MRICHLTSVHPQIETRIFHKECVSLAAAGYETHLIAVDGVEEIRNGVHLHSVSRAGSTRLRRATETVWRLYRRAVQINADLYHFHDPELIFAGLFLRRRGKHVIYDVHEDWPRQMQMKRYLPGPLRRPAGWFAERLEEWAAPRFSAIVATTPGYVARFQRLNRHDCLVANYPLLQELAPASDMAWESRQAAVAYVGALALERGLREMVKAMACLPSSLQARLKLAGRFDTPQRRDDVSCDPGWAAVDELGQLNRSQVAGLLGTARAGLVVLHPTSSYLEVWPVKLFEYMAAGIPFIASDFPRWREIVGTEPCGLFVDPMDPSAIARAIEYLLTHPEEAEAMGHRGRQLAERRFSWRSEQEKLLNLYADLLDTQA